MMREMKQQIFNSAQTDSVRTELKLYFCFSIMYNERAKY